MKIETIALQDFKCFHDMEIDFKEPVNLIFGENASGKSSIAQAILFALAGSNNGCDRHALIRHNAEDFAVSLSIGNIPGASMPYKITQGANGGASGKDAEAKAILQKLKTNRDVVAALLKTTSFLELHPDEKKRLLFDLLPNLKVSSGNIAERLSLWLQSQPDILRKYRVDSDSNLMDCLSSPASLEDAYNEAYEERRIARREQKGLGEAPRLPRELTKERLEADLRQAQQELSQLYIAIGETKGVAAGERKQLERELLQTTEEISLTETRLKTELNIHQTGVNTRKAGLNIYKGTETGAAELEGQLAAFEKQRAAIAADIASLSEKHAALQIEMQRLADQKRREDMDRAKIGAFDGHCPIFSDVICETKEIARRVKTMPSADTGLESSIRKLAEGQSKAASLLNEKKEALARIENSIATVKNEAMALKLRFQNMQERAAQEENRLRDLRTKKQQLEGILSGISEEKTTEAQRLKGNISVLEEDIRRKKDTLSALKKARQISSLEERINKLEILTLAFSPKGIMSDLMRDAAADLTGLANNLLAELTGSRYAIDLSMEEGFQILLYDLKKKTTTDIAMASTSERFRVGIVLQAVLSELAGLRFMIIDGIDILDQANKGFFFDFLQKAMPLFDQIIALGTIGQIAPRNPGIPGIDFFLLEDGKIGRI